MIEQLQQQADELIEAAENFRKYIQQLPEAERPELLEFQQRMSQTCQRLKSLVVQVGQRERAVEEEAREQRRQKGEGWIRS